MKVSTFDGFVGMPGGRDVKLHAGQEWPDDADVVAAHPDKFADPDGVDAAPAKRRGRRGE